MTAKFKTWNVTDYNYDISGNSTIPRLHRRTLRCTHATAMEGALLNTDDCGRNASVSQPFLKGKLTAHTEAFDIIHQLSSMQYEENAQDHAETFIPHAAAPCHI